MPYRRVTTTEEPAAKRARAAESVEAEHTPRSHPLVSLQSHLGNRQVARLIAQRAAEPEDEEIAMKRDPALAQRAEEPEEEEEVAMKRDPALAQRAADEEELAMKRDAAPAVGLAGGPVGDGVASAIDASRGSGSGLSPSIQSKMEGAMGTDFSGVRVHHDEQADSLARGLTAKAFTTGSDIFLRKDQNPNDQDLLAHELTHVVQQSSGASGASGSGMTVGAADHADEHEADAVAAAVGAGQPVGRKLEEAHA